MCDENCSVHDLFLSRGELECGKCGDRIDITKKEDENGKV